MDRRSRKTVTQSSKHTPEVSILQLSSALMNRMSKRTRVHIPTLGTSYMPSPNKALLDRIAVIKQEQTRVTSRTKAVKALKEFKERRHDLPHWARKLESGTPISSLQSCTKSLKEILQLCIESSEFRPACVIYELLGEVMVLAEDYEKAIAYFAQTV